MLSEEPLMYGAPVRVAGAIEVSENFTFNDAAIYADDELKHRDGSFANGTIALTTDYARRSIFAPLTGQRVAQETFTPPGGTPIEVNRYISNGEDLPTPQGFGYIVSDLDVHDKLNKKPEYKVYFYYHVEFAEPTEAQATQQGQKAYAQAQVIGTIYKLPNGDWREIAPFDKLEDAVAYLYHLYGATAGGGADLSALSIGSLSLTPEFSPSSTVYLATTTNATNAITATAAASGATVGITVNGDAHTSGEPATWDAGLNEVKATVTNGGSSKTYTVIVTKETE